MACARRPGKLPVANARVNNLQNVSEGSKVLVVGSTRDKDQYRHRPLMTSERLTGSYPASSAGLVCEVYSDSPRCPDPVRGSVTPLSAARAPSPKKPLGA